MKNIIFTAIAILLLTSCSKEYDDRSVTYLITGLADNYKVTYLDKTGTTITDSVFPQNDRSYIWKYNFTGIQGDELYLFSEFRENVSTQAEIKFIFRILIDGKVYKDAYGSDQQIILPNDTLYRVKRAGVIPF